VFETQAPKSVTELNPPLSEADESDILTDNRY
jgi:hypothetical protein